MSEQRNGTTKAEANWAQATPTADVAPIGIVTGHTTPQQFSFVSQDDRVPPRLEYVVVSGAREQIDEQTVEVDLLAQVAGIEADVITLDDGVGFDEARALVDHVGTFPPRVRVEAHVLGFLHEGTVRAARSAVLPSTPVYPAPDELLARYFSRDEGSSLTLGTLINRRGVPVKLDPNGLSRHLAIIAQTGAGKSYLAGKLLEDLLELGATIIVLDPNSDYVQLRKCSGEEPVPYDRAKKTPYAERIQLYRVPGIQNRRYPAELVGPSGEYTIQFCNLEGDDICDVAGVPSTAIRIREAVKNACTRLRQRNIDFDPNQLADELANFAGVEVNAGDGLPEAAAAGGVAGALPDDLDDVEANDRFLSRLSYVEAPLAAPAPTPARKGKGGKPVPGEEEEMRGARMAISYVKELARYPVWSHSSINLDDLLEPMKLTVIDLAGTEKVVMSYTAEWLLSNLWQRALAGELRWPVFVVLEEAHNLVPGGREVTKASRIVNTVAAEGRKFGVFLVVITQRPSKISDDTLSQCASQLIMRLTNPDDQKAVQRASEVISQSLLENLPGLNQGEVVVLGRLTRIPAMVKVGGRRGAEGGADINLVERFNQARTQVRASHVLQSAPALRPAATAPKRVALD